MAPAALVAGLGLPALDSLIFLSVLVLSVACWVIGSQDRTDRGRRRPAVRPGAATAPLAQAATP